MGYDLPHGHRHTPTCSPPYAPIPARYPNSAYSPPWCRWRCGICKSHATATAHRHSSSHRYLWAQPWLTGQESALGSRPGLVITSTPDAPSASTILRVVECKCRRLLGAPDIRAEFGKAYDLRVASYLIWSFMTPTQRVVEGARRLGLDLVSLGFDTPLRADLIAMPENLVAHVANTLEVSKREERFARVLLESGQDASHKMLGPR